MLIELSGKSHYVVTGVTLRTSKTKTFHETTQVFFNELVNLKLNITSQNTNHLIKLGLTVFKNGLGILVLQNNWLL